MTEKELIQQLKELREIKPRKDWVVLTKSQILGDEKQPFFVFSLFFPSRLAWAPLLGLLVMVGLFGFAQYTVPGDFLFSVKKITETVQVGISSAEEKPKIRLQLANKRLEELSQIAQRNEVNNLGPAIEEFQANISEAVHDLTVMDISVTSSDPMVLKELADETEKLAENKEKVERVLGTAVGDTEELENILTQLEKKTAAYLIEDLQARALSEKDRDLLEQAKEYFKSGEYSLALEKLWWLSNK